MKRIIFATENEDKMREIREIMADTGLVILSMREAGIQIDVEENGTTYEENAMIKARAVALAIVNAKDAGFHRSKAAALGNDRANCKEINEANGETIEFGGVLADDSGLEIDYLGKEPGIHSARYMGRDTPYSVKNANLISRLEGVPDEERTARFVCAIAAVLPEGREITVRATIEGRIGYEEKGVHGFGFDPIFYVPEIGMTTAELSEEEKNKISHRGKALRLMKEELKKL